MSCTCNPLAACTFGQKGDRVRTHFPVALLTGASLALQFVTWLIVHTQALWYCSKNNLCCWCCSNKTTNENGISTNNSGVINHMNNVLLQCRTVELWLKNNPVNSITSWLQPLLSGLNKFMLRQYISLIYDQPTTLWMFPNFNGLAYFPHLQSCLQSLFR